MAPSIGMILRLKKPNRFPQKAADIMNPNTRNLRVGLIGGMTPKQRNGNRGLARRIKCRWTAIKNSILAVGIGGMTPKQKNGSRFLSKK